MPFWATIDSWPVRTGGPLIAVVRVSSDSEPSQVRFQVSSYGSAIRSGYVSPRSRTGAANSSSVTGSASAMPAADPGHSTWWKNGSSACLAPDTRSELGNVEVGGVGVRGLASLPVDEAGSGPAFEQLV